VRGVDTNVLARYYLRDDPAQARLAERLPGVTIEAHEQVEAPRFQAATDRYRAGRSAAYPVYTRRNLEA
jgi:hypothetical protein